MPKCHLCGKWGLFLKLTDHLCPSCVAAKQHQLDMQSNSAVTEHHGTTPPESTANSVTIQKPLSYAEKELAAVQRTTSQDIQLLVNFPFSFDGELQKDIRPHGHPFAYMDICGNNISAAKSELCKMNEHILSSTLLCDSLPRTLSIPIDDIVFRSSSDSGYSRILCKPIDHLGKPTDFPIQFSFMTDMDCEDTTHGDLIYGEDGTIKKATIYFWRRSAGYFLYYETVEEKLVLSRVEIPDLTSGINRIVYKGQHLLDYEAKLKQSEEDYAWIQEHLPEKSPKSLTGYRRMKTQNTKNYQILRSLAAELGREI